MTLGCDFWLKLGIGIGSGDWDGGWMGDWDWKLGIGIWDGDLGWGLGIGILDWLRLLVVTCSCDFWL